MTAPYKQVFESKSGQFTVLIISRVEFDAIIDSFKNIINISIDERVDESMICGIKDAGFIYIGKGEFTKHVFDQYEIETDTVCLTVRGFGPKLVEMLKSIVGLQANQNNNFKAFELN